MTNLNTYKQCVQLIRQYAFEHNVSLAQTTEIFKDCFMMLEHKYTKRSYRYLKVIKSIIMFLFVVIVCSVCLYKHPVLNTVLLRNLQNSIYPGLKFLRMMAVPVIHKYPSLSELYDEWCLVENPFFYVSDMDCWPCSVVSSVPDLTNYNVTKNFNIGIPYTKAEKNITIHMKDLSKMYWANNKTFDEDAKRVFSNNAAYRTIGDVMEKRLDLYPSETKTTHILWRINSMKPGRILRKLLPKPVDTPDWWGQSIERFVFIDEKNSPLYSLPNPECSNIVLRMAGGARLIKMVPSSECLQNCKSSTILLSKGHTLWYNWWYWRPLSLPVSNFTAISISYLTSFC